MSFLGFLLVFGIFFGFFGFFWIIYVFVKRLDLMGYDLKFLRVFTFQLVDSHNFLFVFHS